MQMDLYSEEIESVMGVNIMGESRKEQSEETAAFPVSCQEIAS